ncbi:MAG: hypothetical protein Q8941_17235 [Bacteroidota bacterium]|nr:hypothetical protein [Bacteroidota bacterium]
MSKNVPGIIISLLCLLTACKKTISTKEESLSPSSTSSQQVPQLCAVREDAARTAAASRTKTPAQTPVVLLIDFNGQQVQNSVWDPSGTINCPAVPASLLTNSMKDYIMQGVAEDYSGFFVKVTQSEQDYQAAAPARRMRCILTYNMTGQFGNIGGLSFISSMSWGDNTPCFVFCDVLLYNPKYIAGSVAHELGHTFGLRHQSRYSADCVLQEEYHSGFGSNALGWAPVMGLSYYQNLVTWHNGQSILGCDQWQNDMEIIKSVSGAKADDYGSSFNSSTVQLPSNGTKTGILENATDKDAFLKNDIYSKRIKVTSNGNSDLALEVYNTNGQLVTVYDDPAGTDVNVVISGKKYLRVRVSSNQPFVPAGDGFGGYTINVSAP